MITIMKNKIILPFILSFLVIIVERTYAQTSWQWGKRGGGTGGSTDQVRDMATDKFGNVYMLAANFLQNKTDSVNIDGHIRTGRNDQYSLTSWDCEGRFRWLKHFGGTGLVGPHAIGVDTLDGIYLAGTINNFSTVDSVYFDTDTTVKGKILAHYIIKYDTTGALQWIRTPMVDPAFPSGNETRSLGMAVEPGGNVYCLAYLSPGNYYGNVFTINAKGYYVIHYNAAGIFQSRITLNMNSAKAPHVSDLGFTRDHASGKYYMAGTYTKSTFGTLNVGATPVITLDSATIKPMFLAGFGSTGNDLWVKQGSSDKTALVAIRPAIDEDGTVYIGGSSQPGNIFNGDTIFHAGFAGNTADVLYLVAVDSNGINKWLTSGNRGRVSAICYINNTIAATGSFTGQLEWDSLDLAPSSFRDVYLARFNAATGAILSLDSLYANAGAIGDALTVDRNTNFYLGGILGTNLIVANDTLFSLNDQFYYNWFVAKFGSNTNCYCAIPKPKFSYTSSSAQSFQFTYSGSPYATISWDFGDGTTITNTPSPTHTYTSPGNYPVCVTATNSCGVNTACHTISIINSVGDVNGLTGLSIYPNPATHEVTIGNAGAGTTLEVYNTVGIRILRTSLKGTKDEVDISNLAPGVYLMRFIGRNGNQASGRFIKN